MAKKDDVKVTTEQEPTKALTVPKLSTSAVANLPDYGADAGAGFEGQTAGDLILPFIHVLQPLSKAINSVDGARPGDLYNTVTQEVYQGGPGVEFVASYVVHNVVEWVPRHRGGGFVAVHELDSEVVAEAKAGSQRFGKYNTDYTPDPRHEGKPSGNDLIESYYVYGAVTSPEGVPQPAVFVFTSAKIKAWKMINTQIQMHSRGKIPLFAYLLKVATLKQEKNNNVFYIASLGPKNGTLGQSLLAPDDERFLAAKNTRELVLAGSAKVDFDKQDGAGDPAEEGAPDTEKAPF